MSVVVSELHVYIRDILLYLYLCLKKSCTGLVFLFVCGYLKLVANLFSFVFRSLLCRDQNHYIYMRCCGILYDVCMYVCMYECMYYMMCV